MCRFRCGGEPFELSEEFCCFEYFLLLVGNGFYILFFGRFGEEWCFIIIAEIASMYYGGYEAVTEGVHF